MGHPAGELSHSFHFLGLDKLIFEGHSFRNVNEGHNRAYYLIALEYRMCPIFCREACSGRAPKNVPISVNILAFDDCILRSTFIQGIWHSVGLCVVDKFMHAFPDQVIFILITEDFDAGGITESTMPDHVKAIDAFSSGMQDLGDFLFALRQCFFRLLRSVKSLYVTTTPSVLWSEVRYGRAVRTNHVSPIFISVLTGSGSTRTALA